MKVGIFTFHNANNYGAVLQAFGLIKTCESLGYETHIVDYSPDYITQQYRYFRLNGNLRGDICLIANFRGNLSKKKGFDAFRTECMNLVPYKKSDYDVALYGSDQIWNPNISGKFDPVYFGENEFGAKRNIAYAASIGKSVLSDEEKKQLYVHLNHLDNISVRESSSAEMLVSFYDRSVSGVLDPTLLVERNIWDSLAVPVKSIPNRYIFIYDVNKNPLTVETAKKISQKTGFPIVELTYTKTKLFTGTKQINYASPNQFIYLIKNAEYVVTSSFHGTAFSIIYQKSFYTVPHHAYGNRMNDLLSSLGLSNRLVTSGALETSDIDYSAVQTNLNALRNKSIDYLKSAIMEGKR